MSKKLEIKQRRRQEAEQRIAEQRAAARKRNLVTLLIAIGVIVAVGLVIVLGGEKTTEDIGGSIAEAGCEDIQTFPEADTEEARGHVSEDVQYETTPPTYGPHADATQPTGFYDESDDVLEENVVHNLEHGQIVIYYSPDVSEETKNKIDELQEQESQATLALPYDGMDKPIYLAAWGASQGCDEPSQEAVDAFRTQFQGRGPEQVGIPTFDG